MASDFDLDFSEVDRLTVDIGRASAAGVSAVRPVVKRALDNIKKDTVANLPSDYWGKLKRTVSYEIVGLWGTVGYEDRGQGELAGIYEFGSARRAPHPTLYPAAAREAPKFEQFTAEALAKAIEGAL